MRKIREIYDKLNRKNIILIIGIVIVAFLMFIIIFAPILEPYDPLKRKMSDKFLPPSTAHWFGTDYMGRDILSRVIEGSRVSLTTAMIVVLISAFIGTMIGLVSGFAGGALDTVLMRIVDVMLSFPTIVFALAISNFLGTGQINLIIAICCVQWVRYARIARGEALVLKNAEYMEAARSIGTSNVQMSNGYVTFMRRDSVSPKYSYSFNTKLKTKGGKDSTLWLSVNGADFSSNSNLLSRPIASRTGKIKLKKGESIYMYVYFGGRPAKAKLVIK